MTHTHTENERAITVLLVDDDPLVRQHLTLLLTTLDGVTVVGEAGDGKEALAQVARLTPDVVLMDVSMPVMNGVDATAALLRDRPGIGVIALTALGHDETLEDMLVAGARGFIPKEYAIDELENAIPAVAAGDGHVSPHSQPWLYARLSQQPATSARAKAAALLDGLTDRERDVAMLVHRGAKTSEIAGELHVSESTVKTHLESLRFKLDVGSREQIAVIVERALGS